MSDTVLQEVFLGRQPILDRKQQLFAYELLFRSSKAEDGNFASFVDGNQATAMVITHAFTEFSMAKVRAVYRNGRGYTFERLRAKVLYTDMFQKRARMQEKVRARKQKFEDVAMVRYMCLATMDDEYETRIQTRVVNLGVDLSTLEQAFDSGKF